MRWWQNKFIGEITGAILIYSGSHILIFPVEPTGRRAGRSGGSGGAEAHSERLLSSSVWEIVRVGSHNIGRSFFSTRHADLRAASYAIYDVMEGPNID